MKYLQTNRESIHYIGHKVIYCYEDVHWNIRPVAQRSIDVVLFFNINRIFSSCLTNVRSTIYSV